MKFFASFIIALFAIVAVVASAAIPPTRYIIVFVKGFDTPKSIVSTTESKIKKLGFDVVYRYNTVLNGFAIAPSASILSDDSKYKSEADLVSALEGINNTEYPFFIEKDQVAKTNN